MPYLKAEQRPALDDERVEALVAAIEELPAEQRDLQTEFDRRVVAPYEDQKIVENADVCNQRGVSCVDLQ